MPGARSGAGSGAPRTSRTGTRPAQWSRDRSSASSTGGPVRILAETSTSGSAKTAVWRSSASVGPRTLAVATRHDLLHQGLEDLLFLGGALNQGGRPVHDHGPVVRRVVERRAGEDERVDDRSPPPRPRAPLFGPGSSPCERRSRSGGTPWNRRGQRASGAPEGGRRRQRRRGRPGPRRGSGARLAAS